MLTAKIAAVPNHPNRGKNRASNPAANPTPAAVLQLRTASGLTQEAFGELAYKSIRIVQDWESGERRCPPDTWELIRVKLKASDLLKRGRLAPQAVVDLGLHIPELE